MTCSHLAKKVEDGRSHHSEAGSGGVGDRSALEGFPGGALGCSEFSVLKLCRLQQSSMSLWGLVPAQRIALSCVHGLSRLSLYLWILKPCSSSLPFLLCFLPPPLLSFLPPFLALHSFLFLLRGCCSPTASSPATPHPNRHSHRHLQLFSPFIVTPQGTATSSAQA